MDCRRLLQFVFSVVQGFMRKIFILDVNAPTHKVTVQFVHVLTTWYGPLNDFSYLNAELFHTNI